MKKSLIILTMAAAVLAALTGCQREVVLEDQKAQEVKTQFVFNISGRQTPTTKQSAGATQADGSSLV